MAVKDTHKAFERLTDAGYSKEMAEALLETLSESWDSLAAKVDIDAVRGDLKGIPWQPRRTLMPLEAT